jgi:EAL domain-containing protein (putative c-di-GMP-specific phosphodiesterase class I)
MNIPLDFRPLGCSECANGAALGFDFSMAFQPIVDAASGSVFAHEALARGLEGQSAATVFRHVTDQNRYRFDQTCRVKAIQLAAHLAMPCRLSINFMPNAVYKPELCIRTTLRAAEQFSFPVERIIFEITEGEKIQDHAHLREIIQHYQSVGFLTAIDDFGAGYSGLNLLAEFQPNLVKLDMALIRNIHQDKIRQAIVRGILLVCEEMDIQVIAEGIEHSQEYHVLWDFGVRLFQGYFFAKPAFEALAPVSPQAYVR